MATFDPSTAQLAPGQFDPSTAVEAPPPPPRGALAEVGTGFARGALVGLPTLAGQALQFASEPGNRVYEFGKSMVDSAQERGQKPSLQLQPEGRGMVTNALASGAEMLAPGLAVPLAIGAGAAAVGASPVIAGGAAIAGAGALFGAQAGQATLDKAEKAGVEPETAQTAARLNAAQTFAAQTALGAVGGSLLGVFGKQMGALFTKEAGPLTEATMKALTGTGGVFKPMLKELPLAAAEGTAINMGQAALSQTIENRYGIDSTSPWEVAKEQIGPTLGMTALLGPLGLVTRGAQARSAQARTATLANGESAPEIRAQLAGEYAAALQKVNPDAAAAFRQNANVAIQHKLNMDVDSTMFAPGTVQPPAPPPFPGADSTTLALGRDPRAGQMVIYPDGTTGFASEIDNWIASLPVEQQIIERAKLLNLGQKEPPAPAPGNALADTTPRLPNDPSPKTMFTFPDGTTSTSIADVDAYVAKLPANQQTAARAKLLGLGPQAADKPAPIPAEALTLHEQVKQALAAAGEKPAAMPTRKQFAESERGKGLTGQELAKAYKAYRDSPDATRDLMRQDADKYDALQARPQPGDDVVNAPPRDATLPPEPAPPTAMALAMSTALKTRDIEQAFAARDANKPRELDAIANIAKGEQLADAAARSEVRPDPNAPRTPADLVTDWNDAMTANEMDTKAQARVPFEKKLVALGIDKMATHQEQIDALKGVVADKKTSQGMRDRVSMLVAKLEAEMPAKKPEPKPLEATEAAASKTDAQVAREPEGTPTGRQAVLEGLVQPDRPRVEVLEQLHVRAQEEAAALVANPDPVKAEALQTKLTHMASVERKAKALDEADQLSEPPVQAAALGMNIEPGAATIPGVPGNIPTKARKAKVTMEGDRGIVSNESVLGALKRIGADDDIALEFPNRTNAVMLTGIDRQAGGATGRASEVLKALTAWADKTGEKLVLMPAASGDLKAPDLKAWYERNGFVLKSDGAMERPPKGSVEAKRDARAAKQATKEAEAAKPVDNEVAQGDAGITNVSELADQTADKIAELRAGFAARLRAGEVLSALEKERYDDLNGAAQSIDAYTEGKGSPSDARYVEFIAKFVYDASTPYKKSMRGSAGEDVLARIDGPRMDSPGQVDLGLLAPAAMSHRAGDVMAHLTENGSQPWVRTLAAKLEPLIPATKIWAGGEPGTGTPKGTLGEYDTRTNEIFIYKAGASEVTILHEAVHAATVNQMDRAMRNQIPRNEREAKAAFAYRDLVDIGKEAAKLPGAKDQYGMSSPLEFVAELHSNPAFREFLKGNGTLWARTINAIRRLLGMEAKDTLLLERAIEASEAFFDANTINQEIDASPARVPSAMEQTLYRAIAAADAERTPFDKVAGVAMKTLLPLKTVEYIAHQVRGLPELVATGFSRGVDAHQHANTAHQVATGFLNNLGSKYVDRAERALRAIGDHPKAQALQREMALIGGEASRIGFDYRKNFKDNALVDKNLSPADKPYIDEIHRRFTQLKTQHPELAKVLEDGERLNRSMLMNKVSTIAANVMDARAGVARRLAAELERMDPTDARRAELASQVQATTLESTFAAKWAKTLDFMDPSLRTATNSKPEFFYDGASAAMYGRIAGMFKDAQTLPEGTPLRSHLAALQELYSAQVKNPYFSLGRDGEFFVNVKFKGIDAATNERIQDALKGTNKVVGDLTRGDSHAFFRVGTLDEAQALGAKLVLAGQGKVTDSSWGPLRDRINEVSGVAPALRALLGSLDEAAAHTPGLKPDQAALMKDTLTRQILQLLPETASRSASIGRRGVPGYDANFLTSYARRAQAAVHDTAGLYTNRAYAAAAKQRADAIDQINRTGSADARLRATAIDDEINRRFADGMKSSSIPWVGQATSLSHSFYLGLSPAFFIRTMAQPWHRGLPILGAKFGYTQGMGALAGATPVALKVVANTLRAAVAKDGLRGVLGAPIELQGLNLPPKEQAFISELHLRGQLDLGEGSQLVRAAMGEGASQKMRDALRMAALSAQTAEMTNRLAMGLAAFRLAEQRPNLLGKETSTEFAIRAINLAMDNFDPANTARAIGRHGFAGPLTPLFTQFQNYALQTMQQIARTVHDGYFGQDKSPEGLQRAKEAKREFAGLMATTGMISGALGLPFANAFAGVYNMLMSDEDKPEDVRISIRNWASDTFGKDVAGVLLHGPANAINMDTSTFGLQGLLPGSDFLASRMMWKDRSETQIRSMLGPAVSLGMDMTEAVSKMSNGYWLKGIEAALPIGLRSYFKAAELARVGYTDSKGNPLPIDAGAGDIAWRALGFQTADKADQGDAARDFLTNQKLLQHRRGMITDKYIKALGDPSLLADAGQQLQAFNAANPTQAIGQQEIAGALRGYVTGQALGRASGTGVAVSKRQLPTLAETERFAAMPGR